MKRIEIQKVSSNEMNKFYKELAEAIGDESTVKLYELYKGLQVTFPKRIYEKKYVEERVKVEFNGQNLKELCRRYGYSERWLRKMISGK